MHIAGDEAAIILSRFYGKRNFDLQSFVYFYRMDDESEI